MRTISIKPPTHDIELPVINGVEAARPFSWLYLGLLDFFHDWPLSLATGAVFTVLGYGLLNVVWPNPQLVMTLATGFLWVAPFFGIVFYELSRRRERHGAQLLFSGVLRNGASIGMFGLLLAFILSSWERLSAIMVALFLKADLFEGGNFTLAMLFTPEHLDFVIPYAIAGGVLAALVFSLSVVSLPMMVDRKIDIATAITTSLWVVRENPLPMLVWALIIGALTLLGEYFWFASLAVIFPILGHASWHVYRDLVVVKR